MGHKTAFTSAAGLVLAALVCVPGSSTAAPAAEPDPVRILLVGDSVTQGSSGDWTWRYRLWQHLEASSQTPVDLVGPRTDVWDYLADQPGSQAYVDPGFDQDHAARWGMTLAFADTPIDNLVETYQPDVVVEMLGTNDLLLTHTPERVKQDIDNFVTAARTADPDVDVVLSTVTQTWFAGAPELNGLLADGAAELDTPASRVLLAAAHQGYSRTEHTFDHSHPNAEGEVMIAAAVADQLALLGIGTVPQRPLPEVPLGPRIPSVLSGDVEPGHVTLSWTRSPGAGTTQVQQRDVTAGTGWVVVADEERDLSWSPGSVPIGHELQFLVLPRKGWQLAAPDVASNVVTLTLPRPPSRPKVSVAGRDARSAVVTWTSRRAETYLVELRRKGGPGWRPVAVERVRPRLVLRGLRPGAAYDVRVTATNDGGTGPTSDRVRFRLP